MVQEMILYFLLMLMLILGNNTTSCRQALQQLTKNNKRRQKDAFQSHVLLHRYLLRFYVVQFVWHCTWNKPKAQHFILLEHSIIKHLARALSTTQLLHCGGWGTQNITTTTKKVYFNTGIRSNQIQHICYNVIHCTAVRSQNIFLYGSV